MTVHPTAFVRAAILAAVASTLWMGLAWAQTAPAAPAATPERPAVVAPDGEIADLACSVAKGTICRPGEGCNPAEKLGEEKLPIKITIDFDNRVVMSALLRGYISASRIALLARDGDQLMLHGIEHGFAWLIAFDEKTRVLSMSINSARGAFAGFGDCVAVEELQNKK
jgi:hypothetical protein